MNLFEPYILHLLVIIVGFIVPILSYVFVKKNLFVEINKIKEELRFSVQPKFIQLSQGVSELVELAVEVWRMSVRVQKSGSDLPEIQKKGLEASIQKLTNYLSKYEIEIIDYTGKKYNEGLNLDVLSVERDETIEESFIKETVEPTVMCKGQVVKKAKIILISK